MYCVELEFFERRHSPGLKTNKQKTLYTMLILFVFCLSVNASNICSWKSMLGKSVLKECPVCWNNEFSAELQYLVICYVSTHNCAVTVLCFLYFSNVLPFRCLEILHISCKCSSWGLLWELFGGKTNFFSVSFILCFFAVAITRWWQAGL